jgi:transposase-like protein
MDLEDMIGVKRKKYSKQFKLDALQTFENGEKSMSQVERELGITSGRLQSTAREEKGNEISRIAAVSPRCIVL